MVHQTVKFFIIELTFQSDAPYKVIESRVHQRQRFIMRVMVLLSDAPYRGGSKIIR